MAELHEVVRLPIPPAEAEAVLQRIQTRMDERRAVAQAPALTEFDARLAELRDLAEALWVRVAVRDERIPFVNGVWMRIKRAFHQLIVLYVNSLAGKQVAFNLATLQTLAKLLQRLEEQEAHTRALEAEVATLREQLGAGNAPGESEA